MENQLHLVRVPSEQITIIHPYNWKIQHTGGLMFSKSRQWIGRGGLILIYLTPPNMDHGLRTV